MLTKHGLQLTGQTPDGVYVEICELKDHPWYLGCQFHPEFKSRPINAHPMFRGLVAAAVERAQVSRPKEMAEESETLANNSDGENGNHHVTLDDIRRSIIQP